MGEFRELLPEWIEKNVSRISDGSFARFAIVGLIISVIFIAVYIGCFLLSLKIKKKIISHFEKTTGKSLTLQFIEKAVTVGIIIYFIVIPLGGDQLANSLLGSTAVVAAIVGFAAQDMIKDMFAGLLLSLYKPFDVGSRIEFEDGTTGIVESITLRHVVIALLDTTRAIIPNNKANSMKVVNYSFGEVPRSVVFKFPISFESDIEKAKEIIRKTICENPLTLNSDEYDKNIPNSRTVYFLEIRESSFIMGATVRFPSNIKSEVLKDEINSSVIAALKAEGIKIPYTHIELLTDRSIKI